MKLLAAILILISAYTAAPIMLSAEEENTRPEVQDIKKPGTSHPGLNQINLNYEKTIYLITSKEVRGLAPSVKTETAYTPACRSKPER